MCPPPVSIPVAAESGSRLHSRHRPPSPCYSSALSLQVPTSPPTADVRIHTAPPSPCYSAPRLHIAASRRLQSCRPSVPPPSSFSSALRVVSHPANADGPHPPPTSWFLCSDPSPGGCLIRCNAGDTTAVLCLRRWHPTVFVARRRYHIGAIITMINCDLQQRSSVNI
ncbi:unnamed protein product [Linum tenue]|uniref:Uncharacterized protein n=1 Tax=Linum tenue TaxID=586396 RepID=A0AAV0MCP6_9ROSI|nr:unnamed protein product [Linum tenue]